MSTKKERFINILMLAVVEPMFATNMRLSM